MGQHKIRQPVAVPIVVNADETTFRSCMTEMFVWIRKGVALAEETPLFLQSCAEDVAKAWEDSAEK